MKRWILLLVVLLGLFVVYYREQLYIRDPLASVTRNGVTESGAQVFINYSNDVLLENDTPPMYVSLIQHDRPIGMPATLRCLHWIVCMTDAKDAKLLSTDSHAQVRTMSSKAVEYVDEMQRATVVTLH